jgi:hypothetical protein
MRNHRVFVFEAMKVCFHEHSKTKTNGCTEATVLQFLQGNLRMKGSGEANPVRI